MLKMHKLMFIFVCCLFPLYLGKENDKSAHISNLNNDCTRCKVLTNSFNNWLKKTSRGKYEGGDAAWEEAKLKNYARSEIRLVEIQENLCSELNLNDRDKCYGIAEEVENIIEQWWALDNTDSVDLYSWLCIEKLKYCCPKNHYGDECKTCLKNNNNKVCSNHGICNGEGTRIGNGSCICETGYSGDICDKCAHNYFKKSNLDFCEPCDKACDGCVDSGPVACLKCASGWTINSSTCIDVNECNELTICKLNEFCLNTAGSFSCKLCHKTCQTCNGPGYSSCNSCNSNDLLWLGRCIDEDEQHQMFCYIFLRILLYILVVVISVIMFKKSIFITSIFVMSTSVFFFYFESYYEGGLLYIFK